ncbi:hypothetical protein H0H81_008939 [Sphagnurus paluster]|uniref:Uncharacterized protein n=1 Tax=Sphagnurus paluster TaxID=117069 RepID=A0A9P7FPY2_9AGAR|nr:hypothetical protein H0H81_008939 [Sphagnurus paluster]
MARKYAQQFLSALIIPIAMFKPRPKPLGSRMNYNLTLLGAGMFLYLISTGVYTSKYMYAQHVYSWTTAQPKPPPAGTSPSPENIAAEMKFDKQLARASLAVDGLADALVALTPTSSQPTFIALSCLSSFTSGGNPALHSLGAVCLHACGFSSEVGALFGGMAVLSAIAHTISPSIYAMTYASTVAYFPKMIFVLATGLLSSAVLLLGGIKSRPEDVVTLETSRTTLIADEDDDDATIGVDA